ncbi:MAG: choice-of-anchor Q domain-containing protein [Chloroflexota bacterium]
MTKNKKPIQFAFVIFAFLLMGGALIFGPFMSNAESAEVDSVVVLENIDQPDVEPISLMDHELNFVQPKSVSSGPYPPSYCPGFPMRVGSASELNNAIDCYNMASAGSYEVNLTGNINLTENGRSINNKVLAKLTINANGFKIDGEGLRRIFYVEEGDITINNATIQNGSGSRAGGIAIFSAGVLTLNESTVTQNEGGEGGGVYNDGVLTINRSTIASNRAYPTTVITTGGGIYNTFLGVMEITNSTISGNISSGSGGGISNSGQMTVTSSTVIGNSSPVGAGIYSDSHQLTLKNSIVASSLLGADCQIPLSASIDSTNIDSDGTCGGAVQSGNINIGTLRDNGGPTFTHALLPGSDAIDAGSNDPNILIDQRGVGRNVGSGPDVGSFEGELTCPTFPLNIAAESDLITAIDCFNISPAGDYTINILNDINLTGFDLVLKNENDANLFILGGNKQIIRAKSGRLFSVIEGEVVISNLLLDNKLSVEIPCKVTILDCFGGVQVGSSATVTLTNSSIINGLSRQGGALLNEGRLILNESVLEDNQGTFGGGIYNSGELIISKSSINRNHAEFGAGVYNLGTLSFKESTISGNQAQAFGGGVYNNEVGYTLLDSSTLSNNSADIEDNFAFSDPEGGAIYNLGILDVINSTLSGNIASSRGGAIGNSTNSTTTVKSSTLTQNWAGRDGSGISSSGYVILQNSIVADNPNWEDCFSTGVLIADNSNLDSDGSCDNATQSNNIRLASLQDNGGSTFTHALLSGSDAINAAMPNPIITDDQRGVARPVGIGPDIGAFEGEIVCPAFPVNVSNENELNLAIDCFNTMTSGTYTINLTDDILLSQSTAKIENFSEANLIINGNDYAVDGNQIGRPLTIYGSEVDILEITLKNGVDDYENCDFNFGLDKCGGGFYVGYSATVTVSNSTIISNTANRGGGIANWSEQLLLFDTTVSGNSAFLGGGIYNSDNISISNSSIFNNDSDFGAGIYSNGETEVVNSTISNNVSEGSGSGIYSSGALFSDGVLSIRKSTIVNNDSSLGSGIYSSPDAFIILENNIISNEQSTHNCVFNNNNGEIFNNIDSDGSCGSAAPNTAAEINFGPLQDNGGSTWTHALMPGSVAINSALSNAGSAYPGPEIKTDQRGVDRPQGPAPDVGAYEFEIAESIVYVSSTSAGTVDAVTFTDEDILAYNQNTQTWSRHFDGSDVGLGGDPFKDVDAFTILDDGSILLSIAGDSTIPDIGAVDDSDIIRFIPTKIGPKTEGSYEMYFDGSDVGLTTNKEDIDAISLLPDGQILISTLGAAQVLKQFGNTLNALDEDLMVFTPLSLGENTSGYFALYLDGSDLGLNTPEEDLWGVSVDLNASNLYIKPQGNFDTGAVTGLPSDFLFCQRLVPGNSSSCGSQIHYFDGAVSGLLGEIVDGIHVEFN